MAAQDKDPSDIFVAGFRLLKEAVNMYGEDAKREAKDLFRGAEKKDTASPSPAVTPDRDALLFSLLKQHSELLSDVVLELKAIRQIVTKLV